MASRVAEIELLNAARDNELSSVKSERRRSDCLAERRAEAPERRIQSYAAQLAALQRRFPTGSPPKVHMAVGGGKDEFTFPARAAVCYAGPSCGGSHKIKSRSNGEAVQSPSSAETFLAETPLEGPSSNRPSSEGMFRPHTARPWRSIS